MRSISSYLANYTAASAGFSEGQLKDDPGDGTGSGATVLWANDIMYGLLALAKKWIGTISHTAESETASDILNSVERAIGIQNENTAEYSNTTTYAIDAHVMYLGMQFVSMVGSNVGNNPLDNPDKWMPCFTRDEAVRIWRNGVDVPAGMEDLHNHRDAGYRQYFSWGKYNFGGDAGRNFAAFGVHLDGTVITGVTALEAIFKVGLAGEYHLLDIIAPDVLGTRTLLDARGRAARVVDATGGSSAAVGVAQADQFQGFGLASGNSAGGTLTNIGEAGCNVLAGLTHANDAYRNTTGSGQVIIGNDGTNGPPRTGTETRMKNYTVGVPAILVLNEI